MKSDPYRGFVLFHIVIFQKEEYHIAISTTYCGKDALYHAQSVCTLFAFY